MDPCSDAFASPTHPLVGRHGRYVLEHWIASGGMADVFTCREGQRQLVAKFPRERKESERTMLRFVRESELSARVVHPHIVRFVDRGFTDSGVPFLVSEYVRGPTLAQVLKEEGAAPWPWVVSTICQLLSALGAVHAAGYVHRDVKPDNCLMESFAGFEREPRLRLLDFGIATLEHLRPTYVPSRHEGPMGTAAYTAPEQAKGDAIDRRCDIYAVGTLAYELLTGCTPFAGRNRLSVVWQQIYTPAPDPARRNPYVDLPAPLVGVVMKALSKEPRDRFPTCRAFARALEHASRPSRRPLDWSRWGRRVVQSIRATWIDGVLEQELAGVPMVEQPRAYREELLPTTEQWLPWSERPGEILERAAQRLLLLGAPGHGKTVQMLRIARSLCDHWSVHSNTSKPLPVVADLSRWRHDVPLRDWLTHELQRHYGLPPRVASRLLDSGRLLPLLDGLDGVPPTELRQRIEALNRFLSLETTAGVVVCCRTSAYESADAKLRVGGTLRMASLEASAIRRQLGGMFSPLLEVLEGEARLLELSTNPLVLHRMRVTAKADPNFVEELSEVRDPVAWVHQRYREVVLFRSRATTPSISYQRRTEEQR